LIVTLGALAAGCGVNLIDNGWDRLGEPPPEAGSLTSDEDWPIGSRDSFVAGGAAIVLATICGIGLVPLSGSATLSYGFVAVTLGVLRRAPIVGADTLGWGLGELATLLALGPLAALVGFASQAGAGSSGAFLAGLPAGLIAAAVLFARHFTQRDADARWARMTPVVSLGEGQAHLALIALPGLAAGAVVIAARAGEYGPWASLAVVPLLAAALAAWRLPDSAVEADYALWERWALGCGAAALVAVVVALRIASPD